MSTTERNSQPSMPQESHRLRRTRGKKRYINRNVLCGTCGKVIRGKNVPLVQLCWCDAE